MQPFTLQNGFWKAIAERSCSQSTSRKSDNWSSALNRNVGDCEEHYSPSSRISQSGQSAESIQATHREWPFLFECLVLNAQHTCKGRSVAGSHLTIAHCLRASQRGFCARIIRGAMADERIDKLQKG